MAKGNDLSKLSDDELEAEGQRLMLERGEAEQGFKQQQMELQAEVTRRSDEARLARMADSLDQTQRDALVAYLEAHPAPAPEDQPAEEG